jgi:hypothetical protein
LNAKELAKVTRIGFPVAAEHLDTARVRGQKPFADLDGRRLSSTVGTEQPETLTGMDLEIEAVDSDNIVVGLPESRDPESWR